MKRAWRRPETRRKFTAALLKGAAKKRSQLDALVATMHADYQSGLSLQAVAKKYGRVRGTVTGLFETRGYTLRHDSNNPNAVHLSNGCFAPAKPLTKKEIQDLIDEAAWIVVPPKLKHEWRKWPMSRRGDFIARLRAKIKSPDDRPTTPFSKNVEPFDYTSEKARAIDAKANAGLSSQKARTKLKIHSQGVIYNGELWFWCRKVGYQSGPWTPEGGRPALHRKIWEKHNGRKLRSDEVIRFIDGNLNNFDPDNLTIATRNDVARENQAKSLTAKSREMTALLLQRSQTKKGKSNASDIISTLKQTA